METKIPKFILKLKRFGRGGVNGIIIDADSLANSKDLHTIIGYINTQDGDELKGRKGQYKMKTLAELKEEYKEYNCFFGGFSLPDHSAPSGWVSIDNFEYFGVDDLTMEFEWYCLKGDHERMFSFFRDYYEDIPDDIMAEIKKNKHLSYYLQFTQRKADLKK